MYRCAALFADGRVQRGGVIMGQVGFSGHSHKALLGDHPGGTSRQASVQNLFAVSVASINRFVPSNF